MASSSAEPAAGGWVLPETAGDAPVVVPWVALVLEAGAPMPDLLRPESVDEAPDGAAVLRARSARVEVVARWGAPDALGARDVELELRSVAERPIDLSVGLTLLLGPTTDPWLLIPGLFYGENRPAACRRLFPRWELDGRDPARFVSDRWAFRSDRAATPVVLASDGRRTAALATTELSDLGPTGLAFAADGASTGIGIWAPYHEQPVAYDGTESPAAGGPTFRVVAPGERLVLRARAYVGPPDRYAFVPILRDLHARLAPAAPLRPWTATAEAARLAAAGLLDWHYSPSEHALYETAAFERAGPTGRGAPAGAMPGDRPAMHVAWLSGAPAAAALLAHGRRTGDERAAVAGADVLDAIATNLAPAGTFWGQWSRAGGWGKGWTPGDDRLHARTLGEATLFMARAATAEEARGVEHPGWRSAVASNLVVAIREQRDDGALGAAYHGRTGAVESWAGAAGLAWVPALVEGASLLGRPELLDAARRAGHFYARFVEDASIHGAPEDVDLAPTSEDGYVALMAYLALLEAATATAGRDAGERARWLELARRAADWMLTFRYAYDVAFGPDTLLGAYGFRSRGADQASPANQHLHAYGLICVPELVRLARAADDAHYLERARETLACFRQFVARADGDFNARRGMAPERYYQTAAFGPKGAIGPLSHAWSVGLLLYACDAAADLPELAEPPAPEPRAHHAPGAEPPGAEPPGADPKTETTTEA